MKIISSWKDYYDYCEYLGIDPKTVFVRKSKLLTRENKIAPFNFPPTFFWAHVVDFSVRKKNKIVRHFLKMKFLVFCGKCYAYWQYYRKEIDSLKLTGTPKEEKSFIWDYDSFKKIYLEMKDTNTGKYFGFLSDAEIDQLKKYMVVNCSSKFLEHYNQPILAVSSDFKRVFENPNLKEIDFQKVLTPEQTWQELSMYLARENDITPTTRSEQTDLERHGMDKTSFRRENHPGKPRKRKK